MSQLCFGEIPNLRLPALGTLSLTAACSHGESGGIMVDFEAF